MSFGEQVRFLLRTLIHAHSCTSLRAPGVPRGVAAIFFSGRFFEIVVAQVGMFPSVLIFAASGRIRELRVRGGA